MIMSTTKWRHISIALVAAGALALAGCSSSGSSAPKDTPTGTPIKVLVGTSINSQAFTSPETGDVAKLYANWINSRGGINGHPLQVTVCDDQFDPNLAAGCARDAVSDDAVAVVGTSTPGLADSFVPILEKAGIPWMPGYSVMPIEFTAKNSFPIADFNAYAAGLAERAISDGCRHITIAGSDLAAVDPLAQVVQRIGAEHGKTIRRVAVPTSAQDYSSVAAETMSGGTDCVIGILSSEFPGFLTAMQAQGAKARFYVFQRTPTDDVLNQYPKLLNGIVWAGAFPDLQAHAFSDFRSALDKAGLTHQADRNWSASASVGTWAAFSVFTQVAKRIKGDVTAASWTAAADADSHVDTGGILPTLDFTKTWDGAGGTAPRTFNRSVAFSSWKSNGSGSPFIDGKFFDESDALDTK